MGGVLATHASGPLRFRYGTGRDLLLGARFVQADGTLTWGGAKVVKSVTGYDVPKLLVGSLGTLGVLVEVDAAPAPDAARHALVGAPLSLARSGGRAFLAALLDSPLQPDRAALLDAAALQRAGLGSDPIGLLLSISSAAEAVAHQGRPLVAARGRARGPERRGPPARRGPDWARPWMARSCCARSGSPGACSTGRGRGMRRRSAPESR